MEFLVDKPLNRLRWRGRRRSVYRPRKAFPATSSPQSQDCAGHCGRRRPPGHHLRRCRSALGSPCLGKRAGPIRRDPNPRPLYRLLLLTDERLFCYQPLARGVRRLAGTSSCFRHNAGRVPFRHPWAGYGSKPRVVAGFGGVSGFHPARRAAGHGKPVPACPTRSEFASDRQLDGAWPWKVTWYGP